MGMSFANTTMAQVYSFVKFFVRRGDAAYSSALDAMCNIIAGTFGFVKSIGKTVAQPFVRTKTKGKSPKTARVDADQMAIMAKLLMAAAEQMKDEHVKHKNRVGGKFKN